VLRAAAESNGHVGKGRGMKGAGRKKYSLIQVLSLWKVQESEGTGNARTAVVRVKMGMEAREGVH
jgi:hypothetical protein